MKRTRLLKVLIMLLLSISALQIIAQPASSKVEFLNAPVLFKEGTKSFQQVVASYTVRKGRKIVSQEMGKSY